jgi:type VI protein secretion system component VasK
MRGAAIIGVVALLVCAVLVLQESAGVDRAAVDGTTRWSVFSILIAIAVGWTAVMAWSAYRASLPRRRAEAAAAEAAAAAFPDDPDLAAIDARSRLAQMRLDRLHALHEHGAITNAEFESQKAEVLREV